MIPFPVIWVLRCFQSWVLRHIGGKVSFVTWEKKRARILVLRLGSGKRKRGITGHSFFKQSLRDALSDDFMTIAFSNSLIYAKSQSFVFGGTNCRDNIFFMSKRRLAPICFVKSNSPCKLICRHVMIDPSLMSWRTSSRSLSSMQFANSWEIYR